MAGKNVQAGGAFVRIFGNDIELQKVLDRAKARVSSFAGSLNKFGDKAGGQFGQKIVGGMAGFFAINAADAALKKLADRMREAAAGGDALGFGDVGMAIGESIAEGIKAIPIVGALGDIIAQGLDPLFGGHMGDEERLAKIEEQRKKLGAARDAVRKELANLQRQNSGGDAATGARADFQSMLSDRVRQLVAAGASAEQAMEAVAGLREEFDTFAATTAEKSIQTLLDELNEMAGALTKDELAARKFEEQITKVSNALIAAGEDPAGMVGLLRQKFDWAKEMKSVGEIDAVIEKLRAEQAQFGLDRTELLHRELEALGATAEKIAEASRISDELEAMEEAAKRAQDVTGILEDLRRANEEFGLSEGELTRKRLEDAGATAEQIQEAMDLTNALNAKKMTDSFSASGSFSASIFGAVGDGGDEIVQQNTSEIVRHTRRISEDMAAMTPLIWE